MSNLLKSMAITFAMYSKIPIRSFKWEKEFWLKCTMYYCILTTGKLKLLRKDNIHEEGIDL